MRAGNDTRRNESTKGLGNLPSPFSFLRDRSEGAEEIEASIAEQAIEGLFGVKDLGTRCIVSLRYCQLFIFTVKG